MRKTAAQLAADKAAAKAAQLAEDAAVTDSTDTLEPLVIPANLGELSDDELDGLIEESNERAQLLNGDDGLEGLTDAEAVALIENAVEVGEKLDADKSRRVEEAEEAAQVLAETRERLANRLKGEDEDEDADAADDADDDDADADADADDDTADGKKAREPVAAAARTRRYARAKEHEPKGAPNVGNMLALRDLPGKFAGGANIDMRQAADLISDAWNRGHHHDGPRENTPLLRFTIDTPSDRVLGDDEIENWQKIAMATGKSREGRQALIASGGICAPPEPFYDLVVLAGQQTPVIDSITRFEAKRGAIRWMTSPQISDVTTSVGQVTAAADKLGGTNATKTSQVLPCPAQNTATIDAIYHSLTQGNMGHRTYPEFADAFTTLMMAVFARVRETKALDALKAGSAQVTQAQFGGFTNTLLGGILQAAEAMRNYLRMDDSAVLQAWFPAWTLGALAEDLIRQQFDRFDVLEGAGSYKPFVTNYLRSLGINPTFYVDTETGGAQMFAVQGAGALQTFPATCKWFLAPEGTWLRIDGGTLDFGIVRDSVLNATNDFMEFGEVFETYAKIGNTSLEITSAVDPNGEVTLPKVQA